MQSKHVQWHLKLPLRVETCRNCRRSFSKCNRCSCWCRRITICRWSSSFRWSMRRWRTESRVKADRWRGRGQRISITRILRWVHREYSLGISQEWSQHQQGVTWIELNLKCLTSKGQSFIRTIQTRWESFQRGRSNQTQGSRLQRINDQIWKGNKPMPFACRSRRLRLEQGQAKWPYQTNRAISIQHTQLVMASTEVLAHEDNTKRSSAAEAQCIEGASMLRTTRRLKATKESDSTIGYLHMMEHHPPQTSARSARSTQEVTAWTLRLRFRARSKIWSTSIPKRIRLAPRSMRWIFKMMRASMTQPKA